MLLKQNYCITCLNLDKSRKFLQLETTKIQFTTVEEFIKKLWMENKCFFKERKSNCLQINNMKNKFKKGKSNFKSFIKNLINKKEIPPNKSSSFLLLIKVLNKDKEL